MDRWQRRARAQKRQQAKRLRAEQAERRPVLRARTVVSAAIERQQAIRERVNTTVVQRHTWGDRAVDALSRALRALDEAIRYNRR